MQNKYDLQLAYLHYAIKNELGCAIKPFHSVVKDQILCLNRINEQVKEITQNGSEVQKVKVLNNYTYEILLESCKQVDTPVGRINVSFEPEIVNRSGGCSYVGADYPDIQVVRKE